MCNTYLSILNSTYFYFIYWFRVYLIMSLFHIMGYLFKKEMALVFTNVINKNVCIMSTLRAWFEYIFILIMHFLVAHCGIIVTFIVQCLCRYRYWLWSLHFWYVAKSEMIQHEFQMSLRCIRDTFTCFYTHRTVEKYEQPRYCCENVFK